MDQATASQWLARIFATQELEIDCPSSFDSLAQYVDLEAHGCEAALYLPLVWYHIRQCVVCRDIYECLCACVEMERNGGLPRPDFRKLFND
jgi:predicted anti-sigma-YlaC factor YlaD